MLREEKAQILVDAGIAVKYQNNALITKGKILGFTQIIFLIMKDFGNNLLICAPGSHVQ